MNKRALSVRMRERAKTDRKHRDELLQMAERLESVDVRDIPRTLGIWASCRKRWHQITGEHLV